MTDLKKETEEKGRKTDDGDEGYPNKIEHFSKASKRRLRDFCTT